MTREKNRGIAGELCGVQGKFTYNERFKDV